MKDYILKHILTASDESFLLKFVTSRYQKLLEHFFYHYWFLKRILLNNCTLKKQILKITQLETVRFIKVNELKLTQFEILNVFHFMCVAAKACELFCKAYLANIERFLYHSKLSF